MKALLLSAAALAALLYSAGCSQQTIDSANRDAAHDASVVQREAQRAERKARPDLKKLDLGGRVTLALQSNQKLPHTIRVDASENGVKLRGTVESEDQKALAGRIARDTLSSEYGVENNLEVKK